MKINVSLENMLDKLGRKYRYISDENETAITMGAKAAVKALEDAKVSVEEIDIIVFATDTPEYLTPTNAVMIHDAIGAKNAKMCFDINCDCAGISVALDNVSRMLHTNKRFKRALIVGSLLMSPSASKFDPVAFTTFSDSAVVIELVEEKVKRGFLDSAYFTDSSYCYLTHSPKVGFSKYFRTDEIDKDELKFSSRPIGESPYPKAWANLTLDICENNGLKTEEIDYFLLPPFSREISEATLRLLNLDNVQDKYNFLSEDSGYLGVNSEVFELEDALNRNLVSEGSNILMGGSGVGYCTLMVLYKI